MPWQSTAIAGDFEPLASRARLPGRVAPCRGEGAGACGGRWPGTRRDWTQVLLVSRSITEGLPVVPVVPVARIAGPHVTRGISNMLTSHLDHRRCGRHGAACIALVATLLGMGGADGRSPPAGGIDARMDAPVPERTGVVRDPHVAPAGGSRCGGNCADGRCGHGARRHHPECRHGHCVPHCLVRTESFGYYGTRWRRWPGSGVVPASALDGATPVPTPRSTVPRADEESPDTGEATEESGRGAAQPAPPSDVPNDAADAVRLPVAPGIGALPGVGEPRGPEGADDDRRPTGWRGLLRDAAVTPTLFTRPTAPWGLGRAAGRPAVPTLQPADASADRGR